MRAGPRQGQFRRAALAVLVIAAMPAAVVRGDDGAGASLPAGRTSLKVGVLEDAPPFSFEMRSGRRSGFDYEVARGLCEELSLDCTIVAMARGEIIPAVIDRQIDFAVASMSIVPNADAEVDFTDPYYSSLSRFVTRGGLPLDQERSAVPPMVGVLTDSADDRYLSGELAGQVEIRRYARMQEVWIDLSLNRLNGALGSVRTARAAFLETPLGDSFDFAGPPIENDTYFGKGKGIVVREGDVSLKQALNAALRTMRRDGSYDEIQRRFLGGAR
ncbi:arginine/ornithine transport system substrate-binding protein [Amorphus sp. MBR-141]